MKRFVVSTFLLFLLISPILVSAQATGGLVPCSGPDCLACHVVSLGQNLLTWFITVMVSVIALVFAWGGLKMVMSAGNTEGITQAKGMMTNAIVGLVIMLSAWLIVDTIMKLVITDDATVKKDLGVWNEIECVPPPGRTSAPITTPGTIQGPSAGCSTCVAIDKSVVTCKNSNSCTISPDYYSRLQTLNPSVPIQITEGFPPTRVHQNPCHTNGTCTDVAFKDRNYSAERILAFQAEADRAGFRAVFEPDQNYNGGSCTGIQNCQPYSTTRADGSHFSLYLK